MAGFRTATREQSRLRMTIDGPAGSGKTFTALRFAHALGGRIALLDTERGSASKYAGEAPDGIPWAFDVAELTRFSPEDYTRTIELAGKSGYNVLIIDSLSHAWEGQGGALELKQKAGDSWSAWRNITPIHNRMVDAVLQSPCHIITTMRSRMEYVQEADDRGRVTIRKVGLSPIQRPGMEYEFDIVCDMDYQHILSVSKSRCSAVADLRIERPGPEFMTPVIEWLSVVRPAPIAFHVAPTEHDDEKVTLEMLVERFGAEAVMNASGGTIPDTDIEVAMIGAILESA